MFTPNPCATHFCIERQIKIERKSILSTLVQQPKDLLFPSRAFKIDHKTNKRENNEG
jgi:hypothetical protein